MKRKPIIILGGGYAGVAAMKALARQLDRTRHKVRIVDRGGFHGIKTRYHELAAPGRRDHLLRLDLDALARALGARAVTAEAMEVDFDARRLVTDSGEMEYHRLILALGSRENFFGVPGAAEHAASIQTWDTAVSCSRRIEALFADGSSPTRRIVVAGAGLVGIELAANIRRYRRPHKCEIFIVEKTDRIMNNSQTGRLHHKYVMRYMSDNGIKFFTGAGVSEVFEGGLQLEQGYRMEADLVIWTSGIAREQIRGVDPDARFTVDRRLRSLEHEGVYAAGDFAAVDSPDRYDNLYSAQRAGRQGALAAANLVRELRGRRLEKQDYSPKGELVSLGDHDAVGVIGGVPVQGRAAALAKKANEARYLGGLFLGVPLSFIARP